MADATSLVLASSWTTGQLVGLVVALMVLGFLLLGAEVFVIPGFGVAGVLGLAALGGGVVVAWSSFGSGVGFMLLLGSLAGTVVLVLLFLRSRVGQRLELGDTLEDTSAVSDESRRLLGHVGVAVTPLRPSGAAEFGEERLEVETEGEYILAGRKVLVTAVKMGRVVVEQAPSDLDEEDPPEDRD